LPVVTPSPVSPSPQKRESKRGFASLFYSLPLSFEGEGDKGSEVDKLPPQQLYYLEHFLSKEYS